MGRSSLAGLPVDVLEADAALPVLVPLAVEEDFDGEVVERGCAEPVGPPEGGLGELEGEGCGGIRGGERKRRGAERRAGACEGEADLAVGGQWESLGGESHRRAAEGEIG